MSSRSRRGWLAALLLLCASPGLASTGPIPLIIGPKGPVSLPTGTDSWGAFRMPSGMDEAGLGNPGFSG